jgi:hypothetical protein
MDMIDPQPTLVEILVRHVLLPRALLPQIEINSVEVYRQKFLQYTGEANTSLPGHGTRHRGKLGGGRGRDSLRA